MTTALCLEEDCLKVGKAKAEAQERFLQRNVVTSTVFEKKPVFSLNFHTPCLAAQTSW